jgi:hypothetical protein
MKRVCAAALLAIALGAFTPAWSQGSPDDGRRFLIRTLRLEKTLRVAVKRLAAAEPQLAACLDRAATDERLEADLLAVVARSIPAPDRARPVLAFLATPAGRKFSLAVERREPELKPALRRPFILPGGVPMSPDEITTGEAREIADFLRSAQGAPLLAILNETTGFPQLLRTLALRKAFAAECGIAVR